MKSPLLLILFFLIVLTSGCHKVGTITYPTSINYGDNILKLNAIDSVTAGESYSLEVDMTKKSDLKLVFTNLSDHPTSSAVTFPKWLYDFNDGWNIGNYENDQQTFHSIKEGKTDMQVVFTGVNGKCRIDFYENSNNITNSKLIRW